MGWINSLFSSKESVKKYAEYEKVTNAAGKEVVLCPDCRYGFSSENEIEKHRGDKWCLVNQEQNKKRDQAVERAYRVLGKEPPAPTGPKHPLIQAIDDGHEVTMTYRGLKNAPDEVLAPRTVIPVDTDPRSGQVFAFDIGSQGWRKFDTSKVEKIIKTAPASISRENLPDNPDLAKAKAIREQPKPAGPTPEELKALRQQRMQSRQERLTSTPTMPTELKTKWNLQGLHDAMLEAIRQGQKIRMEFTPTPTRERPETSPADYTITPSYIIMRGRAGYVRAFHHESNQIKTFNLKGISKVYSLEPSDIDINDIEDEELAVPKSRIIDPNQSPDYTAGGVDIKQPVADQTRPSWSFKGKTPSGENLITPTEAEYNQLKGLDLDPDTFDRATVKRLRNIPGVTHTELVNFLSNPDNLKTTLEDYEKVRRQHVGATNPAQATYEDIGKMLTHYNDTLLSMRGERLKRSRDVSEAEPVLDQAGHDRIVTAMFNHHKALRNCPAEGFQSLGYGYHDDTRIPWRRRANEWIMNECCRLMPSLRDGFDDTEYHPEHVLNERNHSGYSTAITQHYNGITFNNSNSLKDLMVNLKRQDIVNNIVNSKYWPNDYTHDIYEP